MSGTLGGRGGPGKTSARGETSDRPHKANAGDSLRRRLAQSLDSALAARTQALRRFTNDALVASLAGVATRWTQDDYAPRKYVIAELSEMLAIDPAMMRRGLDNIFSVLNADALTELVHNEAPTPDGMERAHTLPSGTQARLLGPRVVYYGLAGNVPGLAIPAIVAGLLARSVVIVRDSIRQPILTELFLDTLAEEVPPLAEMVIPVGWDANNIEMEALAISASGRAEVYGSDKTVSEIAARHQDRVMHTHGTRVSIGLVPGSSDTDQWADGFAEDMCMYEGRGCLSPKILYVVGPRARAERLARRMGIALRRVDKLWPRRTQTLDDELARRSFMDNAELTASRDQGNTVEFGREGSWCVHLSDAVAVDAEPGLRCITVVAASDEKSVAEAVEASPIPVAAVGLAMHPRQDNYHALAESLRAAGTTLVCAPGSMQAPPISWNPDGGKRLGDLLQWRPIDQD